MQCSRARKHIVVLERVSDFKVKFFSPKVSIIYTLSRNSGCKHMFHKEKDKVFFLNNNKEYAEMEITPLF